MSGKKIEPRTNRRSPGVSLETLKKFGYEIGCGLRAPDERYEEIATRKMWSYENRYAPCALLAGKGTLHCGGRPFGIDTWVSLRHSERGLSFTEMTGMQSWDIEVFVFATDPARRRKTPVVAIVEGHYIVPFKGNRYFGPQAFAYALDADSSVLNDVTKVLNGEVLPKRNFKHVTHFAVSSRPASGILVPRPTIHPDLRGMGLLPQVFTAVNRILDCVPETIVIESFPRPGRFHSHKTGGTAWFGTAGVAVIPIQSTPPECVWVDPTKAFAPGKEPSRSNTPDMAIERRRVKLTRHFQAMQAEGMDIVTYNPWDYPST